MNLSALATVNDLDSLSGSTVLRGDLMDGLEGFGSRSELTKDDVLAVKMREGVKGNEELGAIGVRACVCHGKETWTSVLVLEVLVIELIAIDGFSTSSVSSCEIPTLSHEASDHSVELRALVVKGLARLASSLLASAESAEVLGSDGSVSVEVEGHSASGLSANGHVKEYLRVSHLVNRRRYIIYNYQAISA